MENTCPVRSEEGGGQEGSGEQTDKKGKGALRYLKIQGEIGVTRMTESGEKIRPKEEAFPVLQRGGKGSPGCKSE